MNHIFFVEQAHHEMVTSPLTEQLNFQVVVPRSTDTHWLSDDNENDDESDDADEDAFDADVLEEEAPSTSKALEEEEDDDDATIINAGLHNVSNTCYLNATVQVMYLCFFLSSKIDIDSRCFWTH